MASFLSQLIKQNKRDAQLMASRELAKQMSAAQGKEKGWRSLSNILKTGFKFIDPTGGLLGLGVDTLIDPIGRKFGKGATREDIQLADKHLRFGGRQALEESRLGLEEAVSDYKKGSISDAFLGFGASKVGGALLDKVPKWNLLNQSFGEKAGEGVSKAASEVGEKAGDGKQFGGWLDNFLSKMGQESQVAGSGGGSGVLTSPFNVGEWDFNQGGMVQKYKQGGIIQKFIDGGMVKKYEEGGSIEGNILRGTGQKKAVKKNMRTHTYQVNSPTGYKSRSQQVYDIEVMEWDGEKWNLVNTIKPEQKNEQGKTKNYMDMKPVQSTSQQYGGAITQETLDAYRTAEGTEAITEQYMEGEGAGTGGVGLTEFKRTQETADLIMRAKTGSPEEQEQAFKALAEIARQTRPELATKMDSELIPDIRDSLTTIDLQGQDYQDLVKGRETGLRGEQEAYKTGLGKFETGAAKLAALGQQAGGMGTSQRLMRKGTGALSTGMEDLFGGYQSKIGDIESGFASDVTTSTEEQFDEFGDVIMGIGA